MAKWLACYENGGSPPRLMALKTNLVRSVRQDSVSCTLFREKYGLLYSTTIQ